MKKRIIVLLVIAISFIGTLSITFAAPADYSVSLVSPTTKQADALLCWAATIVETVRKYKGTSGAPTQADVVKKAYNGMYGNFPALSSTSIKNTLDAFGVTTITGINVHAFSSVQSELYTLSKIYNVGLRYKNGTGGHRVLLVGYKTSTGTQQLVYWDPWDNKYYTMGYDEFKDNSSWYVDNILYRPTKK